MRQYYILTQDPNFKDVIAWVMANRLLFEAHLNRTRFWILDGRLFTEFIVRFGHCCKPVDPDLDLATGL
jgi:hypothetical protein